MQTSRHPWCRGQVIGLPDCGESRSKDASDSRLLTYQQLRRSCAVRALRRPPSVQPGSNAAHDDGPGAAERCAVRPCDVAVSCQRQDAELLVLETAKALVDGVLGPLIDVGVPDRAVIGGGRGNAAKRIVRSMPV